MLQDTPQQADWKEARLYPLRPCLHVKYSAWAEQKENDQDCKSDRILPPGLNFPDAKVFNDPQEKSAEHGPRYTANAADDGSNDA